MPIIQRDIAWSIVEMYGCNVQVCDSGVVLDEGKDGDWRAVACVVGLLIDY
jgi:hypothetical protein